MMIYLKINKPKIMKLLHLNKFLKRNKMKYKILKRIQINLLKKMKKKNYKMKLILNKSIRS